MTAGSYCYIGPQGIVHGTTVSVVYNVLKCFIQPDNCYGVPGTVENVRDVMLIGD